MLRALLPAAGESGEATRGSAQDGVRWPSGLPCLPIVVPFLLTPPLYFWFSLSLTAYAVLAWVLRVALFFFGQLSKQACDPCCDVVIGHAPAPLTVALYILELF